MKRAELTYRPDIDALRAWAVMIVLLFHLDLVWFQGGFVGVDVFFVISGYLITRNIRVAIEERRFSLSEFYARRARRLMPSLLVTLTLTALIGCWVIAPTHLGKLAKNTLGAALSISNIFFWKQTSYFDDALKLNAVTHTWSLSLEEQFYLIYPLLLILISSRVVDRARLLIPFAALTGASWALAVWSTAHHPTFAFFMVPSRLWEFTLGGLVWLVEPRLRMSEVSAHPSTQVLSRALLVIGGVMIGWSCVMISEHDPFPGLLGTVPCLGAALIILAQPRALGLGLICAHPLLVKIGTLSYALYLVHWPLIALYRHVQFQVELSSVAQAGLGLGSFALAYLLHRAVEAPLRRRVYIRGRVTLVHALIASVIAVSAGAAIIWRAPLSVSDSRLAGLSLPLDVDLKRFKRETYGGRGCKPPRCQSGVSLDPSGSSRSQEVDAYVIGDSYALALYAGIAEHLSESRVVFWERGACEFYSLDYVGNMNKWLKACIETKREAFKELKAHPDRPVLLSQHWRSNYVEAMHYHPTSLEVLRAHAAPPQVIRADTVDDYARFVAHELISLKAALGIKRLTVVGGPPKFAHVFSPLDCLLSPMRPDVCASRPLDEVTGWHLEFQEALIRESGGAFEVIDLYGALCEAQDQDQRQAARESSRESRVCKHITDSGELIYSDYGHLSTWGSRFVVSKLLAQFKRALGR